MDRKDFTASTVSMTFGDGRTETYTPPPAVYAMDQRATEWMIRQALGDFIKKTKRETWTELLIGVVIGAVLVLILK